MQNEQLRPFLFEGEKLVRAVMINDEPWFVGKDVAKVLGHRDATAALRGLEDDERGTHIVQTTGGKQEMIVVSEAGVFQLIFTGRKEEAKRFKRWLAHEVLPSIRRTGAYTTGQTVEQPVVRREFPEWPFEEMRAKRSIVGMYQQLWGNLAGQWACPMLGFPLPPKEILPTEAQYAMVLVQGGRGV